MTQTSPNAPRPQATRILCVGSVLWDVIGRSDAAMRVGSDVPGRILRHPGGVVLNIAMTLRRFGMAPVLLTALGRDPEGETLIRLCQEMGLDMSHAYLSDDMPTDQYMAIEGANGLIAAIADAHSLEAAGDRILAPLLAGPFGSVEDPYPDLIALDGNLTEDLLQDIAESPAFRAADLRVAPASPGKARRLLPLMRCPNATLYLNLEEAGLLLGHAPGTAKEAGLALVAQGAARVLVTNGGEETADCGPTGAVVGLPPAVTVTRITGAGDTFMAAHMAAEAMGATPEKALEAALAAAAAHVSGKDPS